MHVRPYLPCVIQGLVSTKGLYDTGADLSCMDLTLFRQIPIEKRPKKIGLGRSVTVASNDSMQPFGVYLCEVTVNGKIVPHPFHVYENMNKAFIFGMDFIEQHHLYYDMVKHVYHWDRPMGWNQSVIKLRQAVKLNPLSVTHVPVQLVTEFGVLVDPKTNCVASMGHHTNPLLSGGPFLINGDQQGHAVVPLYNCSAVKVELPKSNFVGILENLTGCPAQEVNPAYVNSIVQQMDQVPKSRISA